MDHLSIILSKIISVLKESSENDWLEIFKEITKNYEALTDSDETVVYRRNLLRMYS